MFPIFPWWILYRSEDLPDLTPEDDEDMYGLTGTIIAWLLATAIWILANYFLFSLKVKGYYSFETYMLLMIPLALLYAGLLIVFIKGAFKIARLIANKKKKKINE